MVTAELKKKGITRVLVEPDWQGEFLDERSSELVNMFLEDHPIDIWVQLGDLIDGFSVSHWNTDKNRTLEGRRLLSEYKFVNEHLDKRLSIIRRDKKRKQLFVIEGNHEDMVTRWLDKNHTISGLVEPELWLKFHDRGIKYVRSWTEREVLRIGKAHFIHGGSTAPGHALVMARRFPGQCIFYGHTHDMSCASQTIFENGSPIVAQSMGCLCRRKLPYSTGNRSSNNWEQGFGMFYFFPDGRFSYYLIRIVDYQFVSPEGKIYKN